MSRELLLRGRLQNFAYDYARRSAALLY